MPPTSNFKDEDANENEKNTDIIDYLFNLNNKAKNNFTSDIPILTTTDRYETTKNSLA